jgi:hypothetical protein
LRDLENMALAKEVVLPREVTITPLLQVGLTLWRPPARKWAYRLYIRRPSELIPTARNYRLLALAFSVYMDYNVMKNSLGAPSAGNPESGWGTVNSSLALVQKDPSELQWLVSTGGDTCFTSGFEFYPLVPEGLARESSGAASYLQFVHPSRLKNSCFLGRAGLGHAAAFLTSEPFPPDAVTKHAFKKLASQHLQVRKWMNVALVTHNRLTQTNSLSPDIYVRLWRRI